jgi:hypothetical protein
MLVKSWQGVYNSARFRQKPERPAYAGKVQPGWKTQLSWKFIRRAKVIPKGSSDFSRFQIGWSQYYESGVRGARGRIRWIKSF